MIWDLFKIVDCEDERLIGSLAEKAKFPVFGGQECYIILGEPAQTCVRCGFNPEPRMLDLYRARFVFPDQESIRVEPVTFEVN